MRSAVIDIGTNTAILLIAEVFPNGRFRIVEDLARIVRLGEGINAHRVFLPQAMDRTLICLKEYSELISQHKVDPVLVVGTAAFRNADNASDFISRIQTETGLTVTVISGDEEAALAALATTHEFSSIPDPRLTIDIGGGSTEYILTQADALLAKSIDMGSVRLTENFVTQDPPTQREIAAMSAWIAQQLAEKLPRQNYPDKLQIIATAGTATTLAALNLGLAHYDADLVHKSRISLAELSAILKKLCSIPLPIRQTLPGLSPKRADVIIAGTLILMHSLEHFNANETLISDRGLRFGVLYDWLRREQGFQGILT